MNRQDRNVAAFECAQTLWNSTLMLTLAKDSDRLWSDAQVVLNHGRIARLRSILDRSPAAEPQRAAQARSPRRTRPDGKFIWTIAALAATTVAGLCYLCYTTWT